VIRRVEEQPAALGVCITGSDFTDYACVAFGKGEAVALNDAADPYQSFSFCNYGYLRVKQGKVTARGAWRSFRIAAPEAALSGAVVLDGREVPYGKLGGYVLYNDTAGPPSTSPPRLAADLDARGNHSGQDMSCEPLRHLEALSL
jgi:hypothetical protein